MGKFVFTTFMLTCLSIALSLPAKAQWATNVTGPDVFGNTKVVASVNGSTGNGLVVQCDQSSTLDLAFLFTATASEMDELSKAGTGIPADLLVKVDQGQVMKFNAMLQVWNDTYIGVVASGRTKDIVSAIDAIGSATSQISVGAVIFGNQVSDTFDVGNSTNAMNTATSDCNLSGIRSSSGDGSAASR